MKSNRFGFRFIGPAAAALGLVMALPGLAAQGWISQAWISQAWAAQGWVPRGQVVQDLIARQTLVPAGGVLALAIVLLTFGVPATLIAYRKALLSPLLVRERQNLQDLREAGAVIRMRVQIRQAD